MLWYDSEQRALNEVHVDRYPKEFREALHASYVHRKQCKCNRWKQRNRQGAPQQWHLYLDYAKIPVRMNDQPPGTIH